MVDVYSKFKKKKGYYRKSSSSRRKIHIIPFLYEKVYVITLTNFQNNFYFDQGASLEWYIPINFNPDIGGKMFQIVSV